MRKIIFAAALIFLVISGCSWFKKPPEQAVSDGIKGFSEITKMNSSMDLTGTMLAPPGETPANVKFSFNATGKSDGSDEDSPKMDISLRLSASQDNEKGSREIQFRAVDGKMFFNMVNFEMPGEAGQILKEQFAPFLNTWWAVPKEEGGLFQEMIDTQNQLREKFKTSKLFTNVKEEGSETIRGIDTTRYRVDLDREALKDILLSTAVAGGATPSPKDETGIRESLKEIDFSGAVWMGEADELLHRVLATVTLRPSQGPSATFDFDYQAWDFGKEVKVEAPTSTQALNPLIRSLLFGDFPSWSGLGPAGTSSEALGTSSVPLK